MKGNKNEIFKWFFVHNRYTGPLYEGAFPGVLYGDIVKNGKTIVQSLDIYLKTPNLENDIWLIRRSQEWSSGVHTTYCFIGDYYEGIIRNLGEWSK